jgi:hypothetical protein
MLKNKKLIICFSVLILLILVVISIFLFFTPRQIFKHKFGFSLPKESQIVNYQFDYFEGERLKIKLSFDGDNYSEINKELNEFFTAENTLNLDNELLIPAFNATCSWWDMNESNIIAGYKMFTFGKRAKTREVYAFIVQDTAEKYFLYAVH